MAYVKTNWNEQAAPSISANNLNKIENALEDFSKNNIRILVDFPQLINASSNVVVGYGIETSKTIVRAELIITNRYYDYDKGQTYTFYSPVFQIDAYDNSRLYVSKPDTTNATKYFIETSIIASAGKYFVKLNSVADFINYQAVVIWYYKE